MCKHLESKSTFAQQTSKTKINTRSNQKHLESFRYVLFHKVQTLERERDPLEEQLTELKDSVQGMYHEMMGDLQKKQKLQ